MPSGKTHDVLTILLIGPVLAGAYAVGREPASAVVAAAAFLFGGIMFGPDLDTVSKQYGRWGTFRFLWLPYRRFFSHRSRWSHGLIFGTLFRVVYLAGVLTLVTFAVAYVIATYRGGDLPRIAEFADAWRAIGFFFRSRFGDDALITAFAGTWLGAASHTLTDMTVSYVKTGRSGEFL